MERVFEVRDEDMDTEDEYREYVRTWFIKSPISDEEKIE